MKTAVELFFEVADFSEIENRLQIDAQINAQKFSGDRSLLGFDDLRMYCLKTGFC
jgi:hypothetical protein